MSDFRDRVLAMMAARGWSTHWIHRSAYLHLEAAELAEAVRGKRGDPLDESADVLITLLALSPHSLYTITVAAEKKVQRLLDAPPYPGEERTPVSEPVAEQVREAESRVSYLEAEVERLTRRSEQAEAERDRLAEALREVDSLKPEEFPFPSDWTEQVEACDECRRWKGHPIQQGICDEHRRPLWARKRHEKSEKERLGYRAKTIASAALASLEEKP